MIFVNRVERDQEVAVQAVLMGRRPDIKAAASLVQLLQIWIYGKSLWP
jgi:hypothetical protein